MKLKGLVWFFTIALIVISLWELSYTWAVRSYEKDVRAQAEKIIKRQSGSLSPDEREALIKAKTQRILDSTRDKDIYLGTSYQKCKENELNLGLDLQGGMSVTLEVELEGLLKSLALNQSHSSCQKLFCYRSSQRMCRLFFVCSTLVRLNMLHCSLLLMYYQRR